jgi:urea transport system permease protein
MAFLLPGVWRDRFGFLAFRSRIRGVYFSILTQALTYAACLLFFRNSLLLGGNNGFTDFKFILGYDLRAPATQRGLTSHRAGAAAGLSGLPLADRTKFGLVQQAIRDSENRVLFSGYAAGYYKLFVFVLRLIAALGRHSLRAAGRHHQSQRNGDRTNRSKPSSGSPWAGAAR